MSSATCRWKPSRREVAKVDTSADPIIWLNLFSGQRTQLELTDYAERYLVDRFSVVKGVANVRISGERRYAMRVWLDRQALAARQLTVQDVEPRCAPRTSSCRPGASNRSSANSRCALTPDCARPQDFRQLVVGRGAGRLPGTAG